MKQNGSFSLDLGQGPSIQNLKDSYCSESTVFTGAGHCSKSFTSTLMELSQSPHQVDIIVIIFLFYR